MSQFLITVPDDQKRFFRQLLRNLPWAQVEPVKPGVKPAKKPLTAEQQEWVDDLKQALVDVERHQRGEIELQPFDDFMKEMDAEHEAHWGKGATK
jgi:hypothetical protein